MPKPVIWIVAVALLMIMGVVGFTLASSDGDDPGPGGTGATGTTGSTDATVEAPDPAGPLNGLNLTAYTAEGYSQPSVKAQMQAIKDLGSTVVTLIPTWYMERADGVRISPNKRKTPSDESLAQAVTWAKEAGLLVLIKPHVDVIDDTFRGDIQPRDRTRWFDSYREFIRHYTDFSAEHGAELFGVGTELRSLSMDTESWRQVIRDVRSGFDGLLTYAANWDEVAQVQFWDDLDLIGVDAYYPLAEAGQKPGEEDLVSAWQTHVSALEALSLQWDREVLLTEIGYPTQADAAATPFEVKEGVPADQAAQARLYRAAFKAFADASWMRGMIWWSWRADPSPKEKLDVDYTPQGKEAESVLREFQSAA